MSKVNNRKRLVNTDSESSINSEDSKNAKMVKENKFNDSLDVNQYTNNVNNFKWMSYYLMYVMMVAMSEYAIVSQWMPIPIVAHDPKGKPVPFNLVEQAVRSLLLSAGFLMALDKEKRNLRGLVMFCLGSSIMTASTYHVTSPKNIHKIDASALQALLQEILRSFVAHVVLFVTPLVSLDLVLFKDLQTRSKVD